MRVHLYRLLIAASLLMIVLGLALGIETNQSWTTAIDQTGLHLATAWTSPTATAIARTITAFGEPIMVVLFATIVACWAARQHHWAWFFAIAGTTSITAICNRLLKQIIQRPRPFVTHMELQALTNANGWSFPSGHASATAALALILIMYIWRWHPQSEIRAIATLVLIAYLAVITWSRVYLHVHYTTDVLAGIAEGGAVTIITREILHWSTSE